MNKTDMNMTAERQEDALLPWHTAQWQGLIDAQQQNRLPHALMLRGGAGLGKVAFAYTWAKHLLCDTSSRCGTCKSCRLVEAGTHVDLMTISLLEGSKQIKIDQIRELSDFVYARPQIATRRVVLIYPADALNMAAANALLKCLEEPGEHSHLILMTDKPSYVLPTVRSRCQQMLFKHPDIDQAQTWLSEQPQMGGVDADLLRAYLSVAHGAPLRALALAKEGALEQYQAMREEFMLLAAGQNRRSVIDMASEWSNHPIDQLMEWLFSWTHATLSLLLSCPSGLPSSDLSSDDSLLHCLKGAERLAQADADVTRFHRWCNERSRSVYAFYQHWLGVRKALLSGAHLNQPLMMEECLLRWQGILVFKPSG